MILRIYDHLVAGMSALAAISVLLMLFLIVGDVTSRSLGFGSWVSTMPFTEIALLYFAVLSAPYLVRKRGHVAVDSFISLAPARVQFIVSRIVIAGCVAATALIAFTSLEMLMEALRSKEMVMSGIDLPFWVMALPLPLSYLLVAIEFAIIGVRGESIYRDGLGESL